MNATCGPEQEFFLIDQEFYYRRPDLVTTGRTLFGAKPPRGQELEDHYFGSIPDRVLAFMMEVEKELYKLGVPVKTRHNEVAPGQFEMAPIYENANLAADHQQLMMLTLRRVARKYGMACLLAREAVRRGERERQAPQLVAGHGVRQPAGAGRDAARQHAVPLLLRGRAARGGQAPGPDPRVRGVRGQRSPPGRQRGAAGHHLGLPGRPAHGRAGAAGGERERHLQQAERAAGAGRAGAPAPCRSTRATATAPRPSPSRATSSSSGRWARRSPSPSRPRCSTPSWPSRWTRCAPLLEGELAGGADFEEALRRAARHRDAPGASRIVFNGDGYNEEWHREAEKRGLLNLRTTLDALEQLATDKNRELFAKYGVLSHRELESRHEVALDQYFKTVNIEGETTADIASTMILPGGGALPERPAGRGRPLPRPGPGGRRPAAHRRQGERAGGRAARLAGPLIEQNEELGGDEVHSKAYHMRDHVVPAMQAVRGAVGPAGEGGPRRLLAAADLPRHAVREVAARSRPGGRRGGAVPRGAAPPRVGRRAGKNKPVGSGGTGVYNVGVWAHPAGPAAEGAPSAPSEARTWTIRTRRTCRWSTRRRRTTAAWSRWRWSGR